MLATRPADVASLAGDHVALTAAIAQAEEQLVGLEISRTAVASALEATRARISAHLGPEGRNARAGQRYAQRGQVTAVDRHGDESEAGWDEVLAERTRLNAEDARIRHELDGLAEYAETCRVNLAQTTEALGRALRVDLTNVHWASQDRTMTDNTPQNGDQWTRLTRPDTKRHPIEQSQLRMYNPAIGMLTTAAYEAIGSPEAVAVELAAGGRYSIVAAELGEPEALKVFPHRRLRLGILSAAVRGETFPLVIPLMPARGEPGRLIFGAPYTEAKP